HLIFLKESGKSAKDQFFRRVETLDNLERQCNNMARALLIPRVSLIPQIGERLFDAIHMRQLMDQFGVWPGVFVWRLQLDDVSDAFPSEKGGLLAYAEENRHGVFVRGARVWGPKATHPYMDGNARDEGRNPIIGPEGRPISEVRINLDLEACLRNGA